MKELTKATSIPQSVKDAVYERDGGLCIICGKQGAPNAHYIARSQLGLGIEENVVTLCFVCHRDYDQSPLRKQYREIIRNYLKTRYPDWDESKLIYHKKEDMAMAGRKKLTLQDFDQIIGLTARMEAKKVSELTGRSTKTINTFLRCVNYAQKSDWESFFVEIARGHIGKPLVQEWVETRLGITVPEEEKEKAPPSYTGEAGTYPKSSRAPDKTDMTGEYLTRMLTAQAAQNAILKSLLEAIKSYGPAILSDVQRLATSHKRMAESVDKMEAAILKMEEVLHDTGKELGADLKDNVNANTEIIRQELNTIKNNTRKRGL